MPSVRELARDLTVNPNTVARAYRELQADNVLQPLRGTGLEITAVAPKKCQADRAAAHSQPAAERARGGPSERTSGRRHPQPQRRGAGPARNPEGPVMTEAFSLRNVTKQYKSQLALDDVTCSCEPGVVFALLGENGAGKTTAIKILLGLLDPSTGEASVLGLDSRKHSLEIRHRVGYVPDQPALYDWMTVDEVGWFVGGFYPPGYQRHYNELVEHFELPPGRRIKELSKGMRAKVSLSVAMRIGPRC